MKAHTAVPQAKQIPADKAFAIEAGEQFRAIKRGIAQPSAQNHTQCAVEEQVIDMPLRHWCAGLFDHLGHMPVSKQHAQKVSERVVSQSKKPQIDTLGKAQIGPVNRVGSSASGSE